MIKNSKPRAAKERKETIREEVIDFIKTHYPEIILNEEPVTTEKAREIIVKWMTHVNNEIGVRSCLICEEDLDQDGQCSNGCTSNPEYGIVSGWYSDDPDEDMN